MPFWQEKISLVFLVRWGILEIASGEQDFPERVDCTICSPRANCTKCNVGSTIYRFTLPLHVLGVGSGLVQQRGYVKTPVIFVFGLE